MDVFNLFAKLSLDKKGYEQGLKDSSNLNKQVSAKMKSELKEIAENAKKMQENFSRAYANGTISLDEYLGGLEDVKKDTKMAEDAMKQFGDSTEDTSSRFGKQMSVMSASANAHLAGVVVNALKKVIQYAKGLIDYADKFSDLSAQYDISTKSLQEFNYIASQTSTTTEQMLSVMTRMYDKASDGDKVFQKLGIDVRDSNGDLKKMDVLFWEVKGALDGIQNSGEKSALMLELFGKNAMQSGEFLRMSNDDLKAMADYANEVGIVMDDEVIGKADKLNNKIEEMKLRFKSIFTQILIGDKDAMRQLDEFLDDVETMIENVDWAGLGKRIAKLILKGVWEITKETNIINILKGWLWGEGSWFGWGDNSEETETVRLSGSSVDSYSLSPSKTLTTSEDNYNIDIQISGSNYTEDDAKELADILIKEIATRKQANGG